MKKLKRIFAIFIMMFSLLHITVDANEQGQVAVMNETAPTIWGNDEEEEVIRPRRVLCCS